MQSLKSADGKFVLEQGLESLHAENKVFQSNVEFWKREMQFLDHLLVKNEPFVKTERNKKELEHFQNRLIYYRGEVLDQLLHDLREAEHKLAANMQTEHADESVYRTQHNASADAIKSFQKVYNEFKEELFTFIEHLT